MTLAFLLLIYLAIAPTFSPASGRSTPLHQNPIPFHSPFLVRALPECLKQGHYRTMYQIVWGCLATIFACTWTATHPNLLRAQDTGFQKLKRKLAVTALMIFWPEMFAAWAMRERVAAGRIKKKFNEKYNNGLDPEISIFKHPVDWLERNIKAYFSGPPKIQGWTLRHAFFAEMGGFALYRNGKPELIEILTSNHLLDYLEKGEVDIPRISEEEIASRCTRDTLSKLIVVAQTIWFIFQCIARWHSDLPLAKLEVLTLAYAVLNVMNYGMWWSKPQEISSPYRLVRVSSHSYANGHSSLDSSCSPQIGLTASSQRPAPVPTDIVSGVVPQVNQTESSNTDIPRVVAGEECNEEAEGTLFEKATGGTDVSQRSCMPMLYANEFNAEACLGPGSIILSLTVTLVFGGIYLTLWSSQFRNTTERELWRGSALAISCGVFINAILSAEARALSRDQTTGVVIYLIWCLLGILCMGARFVLIYLSVSNLYDLPENMYYAVPWTDIVPHF